MSQKIIVEELRNGKKKRKKGKAEAALEEKMDRWVYLTELAERIEAGKNK